MDLRLKAIKALQEAIAKLEQEEKSKSEPDAELDLASLMGGESEKPALESAEESLESESEDGEDEGGMHEIMALLGKSPEKKEPKHSMLMSAKKAPMSKMPKGKLKV